MWPYANLHIFLHIYWKFQFTNFNGLGARSWSFKEIFEIYSLAPVLFFYPVSGKCWGELLSNVLDPNLISFNYSNDFIWNAFISIKKLTARRLKKCNNGQIILVTKLSPLPCPKLFVGSNETQELYFFLQVTASSKWQWWVLVPIPAPHFLCQFLFQVVPQSLARGGWWEAGGAALHSGSPYILLAVPDCTRLKNNLNAQANK